MRKKQEDSFCKFLATEREKANITMDSLCRGLYTAGMIKRIESGERRADKMMQDRLLARLGITVDSYENYLNVEEYELWLMRQRILGCLDNEMAETTKEELKKYSSLMSNNIIEKQFYLTMKAEILKQENSCEKDIAHIIRQAVELTVPGIEKVQLEKLTLSVQELNLILEYKKYCCANMFEEDCDKMIAYIKSRKMDVIAQAKIFPKVVYEKGEFVKKRMQSEKQIIKLLNLCNEAIEIDRLSGRLYYLYEVLQLRIWCIEWLENRKIVLKKLKRQTLDWMNVLGELYQKYGVSANMVSCSYLYWQQETYCINDVIRERREFLGMTRSKLYQGVCSEKTMGRIERKQCNPQLEIVKELFERLQLSTELCHSVVVAERSEAISYSKQIRYAINNWDSSEKINKLIDEARQYISDKETVNRQFLEQCILVARRHEGSINEEEYMKGLKKIMGYTLPYQKMFEKRKGYITRQEQQLFYGICVVLDEKDKCEHLQILASFFEEQKNIPNSRIAMYDLVMTALASTLGNLKKYSESNILSHKVIQEMLKNRRIYSLALNIHNLMWNEESCMEEKDKAEFLKRKKKALKMCITLADLARQQYYEREFISELNELVNQ